MALFARIAEEDLLPAKQLRPLNVSGDIYSCSISWDSVAKLVSISLSPCT